MHTHVLVCAREKVAFVTAEVIAFAFIGRNWRIDKRTCTSTTVLCSGWGVDVHGVRTIS